MADYIPLFLDWARSTEGLSDAEKGRLVDAMVAYATGEDWQNLIHGNERFVMNVFRGVIDRHLAAVEANRANGNRGGRPKKTGGFEEKTPVSDQKTPVSPRKPNNNNNNNNNNNEDIGAQSAPRARARFTPPTVADVRAYCEEKGYGVDPDRFVAYYESNGWRVGRNPMKDWRAAVRTWARNEYGGGVTRGNDPERDAEDLFAGMSDDDIALVEQLANDGEHWG